MKPVGSLRTNKRKSLSPHRSSKKQRNGERATDETEVIVLSDDENNVPGPSGSGSSRSRMDSDALDPGEILRLFRITPANLRYVTLHT